jgi:two-component system, NtrC family, sensor kinase
MPYDYGSNAELEKLSRDELFRKLQATIARGRKLEDLIEIISRGKYMWESTFDAITAPVQIVSADYEILRANLKFAAVSGKDIASLIGKKCYEVFAGRKTPCEACPLSQALERDEQRSQALRNAIGQSEFEANVYPLSGGEVPESAVLYYRDITEERRLQREVVQQEKMAAIGILAGGVAHEINNPLGGILAFTQLIKRDSRGNESLVADLEEIERAAVRCKKIVADLLEFSRVTKESDRMLVDVNVLLEKIFPFVQCEIRSYNVELDFRGGPMLPQVRANPDRLQQVFINLMTNSCHAMPKGGKLTVETRAEGEGRAIEVLIADTGRGIAREIRERIFEPFFTTKGPGGGTGLGLSISYRIVKDHGGEILCESVEGEGTTFIVRLPAASSYDDGGD